MKDSIKQKLDYYISDIGIYPAANNGVERTSWQDGWNSFSMEENLDSNHDDFKDGWEAAKKEYEERSKIINDWYDSLSEYKEIIDDLLEKDILCLTITEDNTIKMSLNSSDLFAWGYADLEFISNEELALISEASKTKYGIDKYICKKNNLKPQYPHIWNMYENGEWDQEMEKLKDNEFNTKTGWKNYPDKPFK